MKFKSIKNQNERFKVFINGFKDNEMEFSTKIKSLSNPETKKLKKRSF